ncbi:hypothetical protein OESDEN_18368, partial [Oesophagostomum dentatum]
MTESSREEGSVCVREAEGVQEARPVLLHIKVQTFRENQDHQYEELRVRVEDAYRGEGYEQKRSIISRCKMIECVLYHHAYNPFRAVNANRTKVSMAQVPSYLANLWDGTTFLHLLRNGLHVYFSETVIEKACRNGLTVLVADGVHSKAPNGPRRGAQLY